MKAGFFFQNKVSIDLLLSLAEKLDIQFIGVFFKDQNSIDLTNPKIFKSEDELLAQIEVAYIFLDEKSYFDFTVKALKRGVNVFLDNLPNYTYNSLIEINQLAFEINIPIGFGCSGDDLIKQDEIVSNYFMLQLTRDTGAETSDEIFRRMLIYDLASFVRIRPCGLRKFRVNGLPLFTKSPKAINLRMEYDNGSTIAYSITRVNQPQRCVLRFFSGEDGYFKDLSQNNQSFSYSINTSSEKLLVDESFINSIALYTNEIKAKSSLSFGLENAIETLSITESIEDRLFPMN